MSKKLCGLLLPVIAIMALAAFGGVAQAAPHWQECTNAAGHEEEFSEHKCTTPEAGGAFGWLDLPFNGEKREVLTHGTLTLIVRGGPSITCTVKDRGFIWNNAAGEGEDEVTEFTNTNCKSTACTSPTITAEKLPWSSKLIAGPADEIKGIQIKAVCGATTLTFTGTLTPAISEENGTATFSEASGELAAGSVKAFAEGSDALELQNGWAVRAVE